MPKTKGAVPPVRQTVRVPAEPARAFRAFTRDISAWWDPKVSTNPTKSPIAQVVVEPNVDGR